MRPLEQIKFDSSIKKWVWDEINFATIGNEQVTQFDSFGKFASWVLDLQRKQTVSYVGFMQKKAKYLKTARALAKRMPS